MSDEQHFLLQKVQPAMVGLIDGSLSTLAPIFGIAIYTHEPHAAFVAGLAGGGTFLGGILHTLPFLIPNYHVAIVTAAIVVGFELVGLAVIRWRFFETSFAKSLANLVAGGAAIAIVGALVGTVG